MRQLARAPLALALALALALVLAAPAAVGGAAPATPAAAPVTIPPGRCLMQFTATVRQGPSAGLTLRGVLALAATPSGAIDDGLLVLPGGVRVPVVGQATGRAISLLLTLADGRHIYGVGVLANPLRACRGPLGGPLVGPRPGDAGDWGVGCIYYGYEGDQPVYVGVSDGVYVGPGLLVGCAK